MFQCNAINELGLQIAFTGSPGPVFCLFLGVSSDYAKPITGQVTEVTCPVIGQAQLELTPSKRQKTGPGDVMRTACGAVSNSSLCDDFCFSAFEMIHNFF